MCRLLILTYAQFKTAKMFIKINDHKNIGKLNTHNMNITKLLWTSNRSKKKK